jgi:putative ABC transport system substrate-binding protein
MDRRAFIGTMAGGWLTVPLAVEASVPRIGFLSPSSLSDSRTPLLFEAFRRGLRELGYVENQSVTLEPRWADGHYDRLPGLAVDLVRLRVSVIVAYGAAIQAAKNATKATPIVMAIAQDPVAAGFVADLARPGGNTTGSSSMTPELLGKQLELFREVVPRLARVGVLANPANAGNAPPLLRRAQDAATALRVRLHIHEVRDQGEIERGFIAMSRERVEAVMLLPDSMLLDNRARIEAIAARFRLPTVSWGSDHAQAGGLISYGPNVAERFHRAATYVDRILKGAKPADLPIEQPAVFELIINLKTARALGLTIPASLLERADRVIE